MRRVPSPRPRGVGLDLAQPRRRPVDLERLAARRARRRARSGGPVGDRPAVRHDRHGVGEALGLLDVVRRHQDRRRPRCAARSMSAHSSWRTCGSRPTVGSSSSTSRGSCTSARAISSRRRMPPRELVDLRRRGGRARLAISSARSIASAPSRARHAVEVGEDEQVLLDGQRHVEVVELRHDAHLRPRLLRVAGQRVAEHLELALVGDRLRGEQPHRRRLARAVGPEQADARPLGHVEVEAVDRGDRPVALHDALEAQGGVGDGGHRPRMTHHRRGHAPGGASP